METFEVNFDGLVGPSHNYSGLSYGNVASKTHSGKASYPKKAALQGLKKMKALSDLGLKQGVLPPHPRPNFLFLEQMGFFGGVEEAAIKNSYYLHTAYSSSFMWTANAATCASSHETLDKRVHLTPANLAFNLHRSLEGGQTYATLKKIFFNETVFAVHPPLPTHSSLADEGAANHTRFCKNHRFEGVHLFVYGRDGLAQEKGGPSRYPARQTFQASSAIVRLNKLKEQNVIFAKQSAEVIDAGVFHNDVISTGNERVFLCHEKAFEDQENILKALKAKLDGTFIPLLVPSEKVSLNEAVKTYLFNSQIITLPSGKMTLVSPLECQESKEVAPFIETLVKDASNPIDEVLYFDLRESMQNGGGPACLRLRIVLTEKELSKIHQGVLLTPQLFDHLGEVIENYYPETIEPQDLANPALAKTCLQACDKILEALKL